MFTDATRQGSRVSAAKAKFLRARWSAVSGFANTFQCAQEKSVGCSVESVARHLMLSVNVQGIWPRGVTVSTLDSESSDRGSNPREAFKSSFFCYSTAKLDGRGVEQPVCGCSQCIQTPVSSSRLGYSALTRAFTSSCVCYSTAKLDGRSVEQPVSGCPRQVFVSLTRIRYSLAG